MKTADDEFNRLRGEFLEMPGLRLTPDQVQRLCGVDRAVCRQLLDALVETKFLNVSADGRYGRVTEGELSRRWTKADVRPYRSLLKAS